MKRDWDLLRQQLISIEEDRDLLAGCPVKPHPLVDIFSYTNEVINQRGESYRRFESHFFGHLELLSDNGYIKGISIVRGIDGRISWDISSLALTMKGHDLLDTMRSSPLWESIKTTARKKGIELTFDVIKALGTLALTRLLG